MPNLPGSRSDTRTERRRGGRIRCGDARCQFGPISELSRTGAKVVSDESIDLAAPGTFSLRIEAPGTAMFVQAKVVSCHPRRDGRFDVAFAFQPDADTTRTLTAFSRAAADSLSIPPRSGADQGARR